MTEVHVQSYAIPNIYGYFIAAGYNDYPFLSYMLFGKHKILYVNPINEIPVSINPQLDVLSFGYETAFIHCPFLVLKEFP